LLLMDFFFPLASGEPSFHQRLWVDACNSNGEKAGIKTRQKLRRMKDNNPNLAGLKWHTKNSDYRPPTKEALTEFMKLLINLKGRS
jgi:hypothetical protein